MTLLSVSGKVMSSILLDRIKSAIETSYQNKQDSGKGDPVVIRSLLSN